MTKCLFQPAGMTKKQKFDDTSSEQQYTPRRDPVRPDEQYILLKWTCYYAADTDLTL